MAAIYGALLRWKDRLVLSQLKLSSEASGKITVGLVGQLEKQSGQWQEFVKAKQQAAWTLVTVTHTVLGSGFTSALELALKIDELEMR